MHEQGSQFSLDELIVGTLADAPRQNSAFVPSSQAVSARHILTGAIHILQTPVQLSLASAESRSCLGKRIDLFPECTLEFITSNSRLVPANRDIQHPPGGESFWNIILSPGCIWAEPGDHGWSRAAFPFVLCHSMENDAHNGLGFFFFNASEVSDLWFQITQQTAPYLLPKQFDIWGQLKTSLVPTAVSDPANILADFQLELDGYLPVYPLESVVTPELLIDSQFDPGVDTAITYGLITEAEIFAASAKTRQGVYPFEQQMRHGSWSIAKSAAATLTMLRLAWLYGDSIIDLRVSDYVDVSSSHTGWQTVTLGDCLNMASGIGDGQPTAEPIDIKADNRHDPKVNPQAAATYRQWYDQPSAKGKLEACLRYGNYSWGPGEVARYRDPDLYMAGVVMDAYYKSRAGPGADLWQMMLDDVYGAIGIHHLPMNRTLEADGSTGLALMAFGMFLTLDDLARIANLYQRKGRVGDEQLLSPELLAAATDQSIAKGLATGYSTAYGAITYHLAFWHYPYVARSGQIYYIPAMRGYGGNILLLLPNGMSAFRFANDTVSKKEQAYDATSFIRLADRMRAF